MRPGNGRGAAMHERSRLCMRACDLVTGRRTNANALGARRFVENARLERGHREGRLHQVCAGQAVEYRELRRADQGGAVACAAGAALVHCVGLGAGGVAGAVIRGLLCFVLGLGVMVRMPIAAVRVFGRGRCSRMATAVVRCAKGHGYRRVPLERHGDHHDPKNEQADPIHMPQF